MKLQQGHEMDPLLGKRNDENGETQGPRATADLYESTIRAPVTPGHHGSLTWAPLAVVVLVMMLGLWTWSSVDSWGGDSLSTLAFLQRTTFDRSAQAREELNRRMDPPAAVIPVGCESTLVILRHCEKDGSQVVDRDGNEHCSALGWERAHYLATQFGSETTARWPAPSHLFALTPARDGFLNFREYETLLPLSHKIHLSTVLVDTNEEMVAQFFDLLKSGTMCGRMALVVWKHALIPDLAEAMGCGPEHGCPGDFPSTDFDQVWQLRYIYGPPPNHSYRDYDPSEDSVASAVAADGENYDDDAPATDDDDHGDQDHNDDNQKNRRLTSQDRRRLHHHHHHHHRHHDHGLRRRHHHDDDHTTLKFSRHGWNIYPTIIRERFDPLAFSKLAGDYPPGGRATGGHWRPQAASEDL